MNIEKNTWYTPESKWISCLMDCDKVFSEYLTRWDNIVLFSIIPVYVKKNEYPQLSWNEGVNINMSTNTFEKKWRTVKYQDFFYKSSVSPSELPMRSLSSIC
jgi:hypothetical protein